MTGDVIYILCKVLNYNGYFVTIQCFSLKEDAMKELFSLCEQHGVEYVPEENDAFEITIERETYKIVETTIL